MFVLLLTAWRTVHTSSSITRLLIAPAVLHFPLCTLIAHHPRASRLRIIKGNTEAEKITLRQADEESHIVG